MREARMFILLSALFITVVTFYMANKAFRIKEECSGVHEWAEYSGVGLYYIGCWLCVFIIYHLKSWKK